MKIKIKKHSRLGINCWRFSFLFSFSFLLKRTFFRTNRPWGAGNVKYDAVSSDATNITYSLDAITDAFPGNSINSNNGMVTYAGGWTGTSIITAEASGCGGPTTATHTVTTTPTVGTPIFNSGATSTHCKAGGNVIYEATATNATGITYSLNLVSTLAGNSINSSTGEVTYTPSWTGTSTITATAAGCNGPTTANHVVTINSITAIDDSAFGYTGEPLILNIAANDLCDVDDSSITITTDPIMGSVQIGTGGNVTYLPNGAGVDQFTYTICSNFPVVCDEATVVVVIEEDLGNVCAEANDNKLYYLPFPENSTQLRKALLSSASTNQRHSTEVKSIFTLSSLYPGTIVTFDHWEDGYEANINDPQQSTTLVWGDGDVSNGDVSTYCALCIGDNIPAGGDIITENIFTYNPRNSSTIVFDGKDKVFTTADVSISKIAGDNGDLVTQAGILFSLQNVKTNVLDVTRFGKLFVIPLGEDISGATFGNTGAFKYASLFVRAVTDGTVVNLDYNGDDIVDATSPTLNEGDVWFYDGTGSTPGVTGDVNNANDIQAGAIVTANYDVGVDLVFGGIDSYGTRNVAILPGEYYNNTYYSPVYSTNTSAPVYAFFTNTSSSAITIDWSNGASGSGTVAVPAKSTRYLNLNAASGYKFESQGGETYSAIVVIDADGTSSTYDWAFNLIPETRLTNVAGISWAPGGATATANHAPVWVTAKNNSTTIYIKYDGDFTDAGNGTSPCGLPYDVSTTINALQSYKILDPDNDQTGLVVFTCVEEDKLAVAWGEDPLSSTPTGSPAQDVGYVMEPKCISQLILANDDYEATEINTPITVNVASNDAGFLVTPDPTSVSTTGLLQPTDGSITVNPSGTITYLPNPNFVGIDTFEYVICAIEDGGLCDIATVYITVSCEVAGFGKNGIYGTIFEDVNLDTIYGLGDPGLSGITVFLYEDNNQNGAVDAGDTQIDTDDSDADGNYSFEVTLPTVSNSVTYNNTTSGTLNEQANCNNQIVRTFNVTENLSITDLNVGLNLAHTYRGDLRVQLTSPSNTTVTLIAQAGDSDDNYNLLLDDSSANPYDNGGSTDPLSPLYQLNRTAGPANPLSAFNSQSTQGTWTLSICNTDFSSSNGRTLTYNSARLIFTGTNNTQKYYVMEVDQGDFPIGATMTTDNVETAVFSTIGISDCNNDFGLQLNSAPVSNNDAFTECANVILTGDLFADNGNGVDSDPDGNTITITQVNGSGANVGSQITLASGALLIVNNNGTFTYNTNGQFNTGGVETFTYVANDGFVNGNTATVTITIHELPTVSCPANQSVCESALPLNLSVLGAIPGGMFSGTGVTGTNYSASAGTTNTLTYTYTDGNGCTNSCTFDVTVNALPTMSCPANQSVCASALPLDLSGLGATPNGGTFSGTGVTGTNYSANPGTKNTVTYTFTDGNGCANSCTFDVTVNALPMMSCPFNQSVCELALPLDLSGLGAIPNGGTFSGTGVTGTNYSASVGTTNTVAYTFTGGNGCANSCTFDVTVYGTPAAVVVSPVTYCQDDTALPLTPTRNNLLWYTVPTGGIGSTTAPTPSTATAGITSYYVSQVVNNCEGPRAEIEVTVNPTPAAPTMINANHEICDDQTATLTANVGAGQTIDWYDASSGGDLMMAGSPTYQTAIAGIYYVQARLVSDGCISNNRSPIQLTVNDCPCDISSITEDIIYNDNNTPNNIADDTFTFLLTVNGTDALGWESGSITGNLGEAMLMGPYPVGGQGVTLNINLIDRPSCSVSVSANQSPCIYTETCTCCGG